MTLIRTAMAGDRSAIRAVVRAAFDDDGPVDLIERVWAAAEYLPDLDLVAEEGGAVVGHVLHHTGYVVDRSPARGGLADRFAVVALTPLAVAPDQQRRGIGTALVREGIARANAAGHPVIQVLGHPDYYPRFGFVGARSIGITPNIPLSTEPDPFMALRLDAYDESIKGEFRYCWE